MKKESTSTSFWRWFTNFWTLIFFAAILYDFALHNRLTDNQLLLGIAAIYAASLAIYSAEKEFRRWHHEHTSMHPGEVYAIVWTLLMIFIICGNVFFEMSYHIPAEVSASYIAVISILAITKESKNYYKKVGMKKK